MALSRAGRRRRGDWQHTRSLLLTCAALGLLFSSFVPAQELEGPPEGKARVYFFHFKGGLVGRNPAQIFADRSYMGFIESSHCYGVDLAEGEHLLWARSANQNWFLRAELEAGRTYYVHLKMSPPKFVGPLRPKLYPAARTGKGKGTLKDIKKRLEKGSFAVHDRPPAERVEQRQLDLEPMIEEVMKRWEESWSKEDNWPTLKREDYVE